MLEFTTGLAVGLIIGIIAGFVITVIGVSARSDED